MCGRFALNITPRSVADYMSLVDIDDFPPRYNIAPTQPILIVTSGPPREPGSNLPGRQSMLARWGLIPAWTKDPRKVPALFNARSESAIEKASFRAAMRHRRILIPASGFYEWRRAGGKTGQAYWIRPRHGELVAFGGLLETYAESGGSEVDTAAVLTTAANGEIAAIHDRMPVVIGPQDFARWLDCSTQEPRDVVDLMRPPEPDLFEAIPVSDRVNKADNTGPELQERVEPSPAEPLPPREDRQMSLF